MTKKTTSSMYLKTEVKVNPSGIASKMNRISATSIRGLTIESNPYLKKFLAPSHDLEQYAR